MDNEPYNNIFAARSFVSLQCYISPHQKPALPMISISINGTSHAVSPALLAGEDLRYFVIYELVQAKLNEGKPRMMAYRSVARFSGISCRQVRRIFTEYPQAHHEQAQKQN